MARSFLWYDLETFGLDPRGDRIAQFAALRTDGGLEPVGERLVLYCKPAPDYLPSPYSCLVHGITPAHALEEGVGEYELAARIRAEMTVPGTVSAGFNTLRFDDEFVRNLFYRNFHDPYEREYAGGNGRWDLIDLARAARDLRPEGIVWPADEEGKPLFTLVALAKANGLAHESAHDAMHDVLATIDLARLLRERQPRLFSWYLSHRSRASLRPLIDLDNRAPLVHASAAYTSTRGCSTLVAPIALDPGNRNNLLALDLRFDPASVMDLPVEELRRRIFTKKEELETERLPLVRIRLNACPFLAPAAAMSPEAAERLGVDLASAAERVALLRRSPDLLQKLVAAHAMPEPPEEPDDPDLRIYSGGFFPDEDREKLALVHRSIAEKGAAAAKAELYALRFRDERIPQMLRRLYARNFPETLGAEEAARWRAFCAARLQMPTAPGATDLATYSKIIGKRLEDPATPARDKAVLLALLDWRSRLERELLSYPGL